MGVTLPPPHLHSTLVADLTTITRPLCTSILRPMTVTTATMAMTAMTAMTTTMKTMHPDDLAADGGILEAGAVVVVVVVVAVVAAEGEGRGQGRKTGSTSCLLPPPVAQLR